ncbi:MAG: ribosome recycling factor [Alphaproteobacteria bacterium]|jgi:ribosome recycling factor|nr:ribosome recycling factor [Alphaproteobacteria bacterium]MBK9585063.1 ribosome recycling factor [Alphaproteobacteria bacterium]MBP7757760.1 ribosome recycling factor [Alphaproteobacteria bacterium]MBP7761040.1 ribosome recycling factor [Alphaproteobacteria bacterium]MBP7905817.1 ribosome recycling factor [Alphaproteobacteria bacterium]
MSFDKNDIQRRMNGAVETLNKEFAGLRTGRASASLLDPVTVEVYGTRMPINQIGTVNVPEPRLISVQVWDNSNVRAVEKAIREAGLGLNPQIEGTLLRIPVPDLNQERRAELSKIAGKYAEAARVSVRNVRRDGMETLKKLEKEKKISEDDHKKKADEVQKMTDETIKKIDKIFADKEKDIMTV